MNNYQIDRKKWQLLTIFEQMGNIYSEVGRTFAAKQRGSSKSAEDAMVRALDLFDATSEQLAYEKSPKLRELHRTKELFINDYVNNMSSSLDTYFMQFAVAARLRRQA